MLSVDLTTRDCDGHVIVVLRGELDAADAAGVVAAFVVIVARQPEIIVDLARLGFIDSSGGGALGRGGGPGRARRAGAALLRAAPRREVLRPLSLTRLFDVFPVHASVDKAARRTAAA